MSSGDGWDLGASDRRDLPPDDAPPPGFDAPMFDVPAWQTTAPSSTALFDGQQPAASQRTGPAKADPKTAVIALAAAGVTVAASFVLLAIARSGPTGIVLAWVLGGFATIGLLLAYAVMDARQRARSSYVIRKWPDRVALVVAVAATSAVVLSALAFAFYAGRAWSFTS